jgi:hypothetical protein
MATTQENTNNKNLLLDLPPELQLIIYEMVVTQDEIFLLNQPCNSSYRKPKEKGQFHFTHYDEKLKEDEEAWKSGAKQPPKQPAITKVSRAIRSDTLPIFYGVNIFRARYCDLFDPKPLPDVVKWLGTIGPENRRSLRNFYFYDRSCDQDQDYPDQLERLKESEIFTEMEGSVEDLSDGDQCAHLLKFGVNLRRDKEVPLAKRLGTKVLKLEGEI